MNFLTIPIPEFQSLKLHITNACSTYMCGPLVKCMSGPDDSNILSYRTSYSSE